MVIFLTRDKLIHDGSRKHRRGYHTPAYQRQFWRAPSWLWYTLMMVKLKDRHCSLFCAHQRRLEVKSSLFLSKYLQKSHHLFFSQRVCWNRRYYVSLNNVSALVWVTGNKVLRRVIRMVLCL